MNFLDIVYKKEEGVATLTLNRPDVLNAMSERLGNELVEAIDVISRDEDVRAVVITGAGRAFCAGADLQKLSTINQQPSFENRKFVRGGGQLALAITNLEKPVIAAVNGHAVGAGCNLALSCDLILASNKAVFSQIFVKIGAIADMGGLYFLPRLIGLARAKELFFTGKMVPAEEAAQMGMINRVVPHEQLQAEAMKLAGELASAPTKSIGMVKMVLNRTIGADLPTVVDYEALIQAHLFLTEDFQEGVRAFLGKREPKYKGK